ncbi:MAG: hypothetical protein IH586_16970 [Anaerolineaceae bacterium]|nr:hypothetical protein [Anaerolineaceae bacterium]
MQGLHTITRLLLLKKMGKKLAPIGIICLAGFAWIAMLQNSTPTNADLGNPVYLPILYGKNTPVISGCPVFPANSFWNTPVDNLPVDPNSNQMINSAGLGADTHVHADFGSGTWDGGPIGIPYTVVPGTQPKVNVSFEYYNESDPGPYPIPPNPPIEGGPGSDGDRHILIIDRDQCKLYELYSAYPQANGTWKAGSGAIFDLRSNALRPADWTSADAAGLAILPGLVRYEEAATGEILHAIRFTSSGTKNGYIWPARHKAGSCPACPPMGQRFRLKASFNTAGFSPQARIILTAMKKYGLIVADNGSPWFISGVPDERWDNDALHELHNVHGSDFEAILGTNQMISVNSGEARQP